jgi:hypothetical protein
MQQPETNKTYTVEGYYPVTADNSTERQREWKPWVTNIKTLDRAIMQRDVGLEVIDPSSSTSFSDLRIVEVTEQRNVVPVALPEPVKQRMHIATVEFAIVLDEVSIEDEVRNLTSGIQEAYDDVISDMPDGSFRLVALTSEIDHRDLDPCFGKDTFVAGWNWANGHQSTPAVGLTPMQALQNIREHSYSVGRGTYPAAAMTRDDFEQFVMPFTHAPNEDTGVDQFTP